MDFVNKHPVFFKSLVFVIIGIITCCIGMYFEPELNGGIIGMLGFIIAVMFPLVLAVDSSTNHSK